MYTRIFTLLTLISLTLGSNAPLAQESSSNAATDQAKEAIAIIHALGKAIVSGTVTFAYTSDNKIKITASISGLDPKGVHAIHIHEFGDCSSSDGISAGGHYNPDLHDHAGPDSQHRHAGDLGNLTADEFGVAQYELLVDNISLSGKRNPVIGRSIIIHAGSDDYKTQPTGNAGGRIGCGVIGNKQSVIAPSTPQSF